MTAAPHAPMRSWLFAPADSARKMEKAAAGPADIVILDLEDSVAEPAKPEARAQAAAFLAAAGAGRARLWVRINPLSGPHALADLAAVLPAAPAGILLPKAEGRADVERLHFYCEALEAAAGLEPGSTRVAALVTETAAALFSTGGYAGAPRLIAMTWGAEDLADALGASQNRAEDGDYAFTYQLARSLCLAGAAAAEVAPIETIWADFRNLDSFATRAARARRDGFRGMLAIHPAQVDVINAAFTPTPDEIAAARTIVDLFAANPGAGTIGHEGAMLDRPHLARARLLLAQADLPA